MDIKSMIKQKVKNNILLYTILKLLKNKDDVEYFEKIKQINEPSYKQISLRYNENASKKIVVGEIDCVSSLDGFFAAMRWILNAIYFCEKSGFLPVIKMPENWLYHDEQMPKEKNPFEYFFEQPADISVQELHDCNMVYECKIQHCYLAEKMNDSDKLTYLYTDEYVSEMSKIVKKYLRFNEVTKQILEKDVVAKDINSEVLGVHIRGTDYKQNCNHHPVFVEPSDYFEYIDTALKKGFKKIYLATDDSEIVDLFIQRYGKEILICDEFVSRSTGEIGVHIKESEKKNGYKLGLDVITDMYALANCGGIISGLSQVSLFARLFNKNFNEKYRYDVVVSKAINENHKKFTIKK